MSDNDQFAILFQALGEAQSELYSTSQPEGISGLANAGTFDAIAEMQLFVNQLKNEPLQLYTTV